MTQTRLKRITRLTTETSENELRPLVTLEHIDPGTGKLLPGADLIDVVSPGVGVADVAIGDVLFGKLRPYLAKTWLADRPSFASTELLCLRPRADVDSRWLGYVMSSSPLIEWAIATSDGAKMPRTSWRALGEFCVTVPRLVAQRAIADYLDRETARIDALIAAKRRMVELLEERFSAWTIHRVLGVHDDKGAHVSQSGLYRMVQRAWQETSLRHLGCQVQTGPFGSQLHAEEYVAVGWPVVNPTNLVGGEIVAEPSMCITTEKRDKLARHVLQADDIVFGRRGEMGRAGIVEETQAGWVCGTGSLRLRMIGRCLAPRYLKLLLETPPVRSYFQLSSVGTTMENLNTEIVLALPVLVPPILEQKKIVMEVSQRRDHKDSTVKAVTTQIALLQERRQALITAAVTGQLDIPKAA